jgi:tetratricopeptide (TPR) repeat protein
MFHALLVCCALVGQDGPTTVSHPADLATYASADAKAGENADAHVQLALWCEAHGLSAERVKHLAAAVIKDPAHALARGLMGLVAYRGKWGNPDEIAKQIQDDPAHEELVSDYRHRRRLTALKPDDQMRLAAWCERNGLKEEAFAHYSTVVRLDPSREWAWKHLGFKKRGGRWLKAEDFVAEQREAGEQKRADKRWRYFFERLATLLESDDPGKHARADRLIAMVSDSRAVPMIWAQFVRVTTARELVAVRMLGQIEGPSSATGLAAMAVFSPRPEVRAEATQALSRSDPRDIVEQLIDVLRKPFTAQVRPSNGPGSPSELFVAGERFNIQRFYQSQSVVPAVWGGRLFAPPPSFDPFSTRNVPTAALGSPAQIANRDLSSRPDPGMFYLTQRSLEAQPVLGRMLARDVQLVEATNAGIHDLNGRALDVLTRVTGQSLGEDPGRWKAWWADQLGYSYQPSEPEEKPTYTSFVSEPPPLPPSAMRHHSCFGAGTQVRTLEGPRAIESIQVGDRVLSQNAQTGLLGFQPVVAVYHNKPAPTLKLAIGGDSIVVTGIHRFWKAGKGWTMARELKVGDRLRAVGGVVEVQSTEASQVQPVFNLEVAQNRDYFVGMKQMLVHDYSLVQPVPEPFDREPELAVISGTSK